jgi:hypothetical protein
MISCSCPDTCLQVFLKNGPFCPDLTRGFFKNFVKFVRICIKVPTVIAEERRWNVGNLKVVGINNRLSGAYMNLSVYPVFSPWLQTLIMAFLYSGKNSTPQCKLCDPHNDKRAH